FRWFISKPGTRWKSPGKDLDLCSLRSRPPRYAQLGQHPLLFPLPFVRCGVCCCGAVAPRVTAALLGRFLPRLGPLASRKRPFFLSICCWGPAAAPRRADLLASLFRGGAIG